MLGRGSFTESFPLFGYDLQDYEELFEEKVAMFYELLKGEPLTWKGKFTQSLENAEVYPKLEGTLDTYIGVGGTPESIIRAVRYGFPVMLASLAGSLRDLPPMYNFIKKQRSKWADRFFR